MKASLMLAGLALVVLGLISLAYQGFSFKTQEKVLEVGPIKATKETEKTIPLPPVFGGLALAGGVVMVIAAARKG